MAHRLASIHLKYMFATLRECPSHPWLPGITHHSATHVKTFPGLNRHKQYSPPVASKTLCSTEPRQTSTSDPRALSPHSGLESGSFQTIAARAQVSTRNTRGLQLRGRRSLSTRAFYFNSRRIPHRELI